MPFYSMPTSSAANRPVRRPSMPRQPGPSRTPGVGERQFPERVDVSDPAMKAIGLAAQAPAYIYERPLAVLNTLTGSNPATGQKGFVEQAGDTLMGMPVVGDALRGIGNVLDASNKLAAGAYNADPALALKMIAGMPNSAKAPDQAVWRARNSTSALDPLVEFIRGDKSPTEWTVGDLRQYLARRGFTPEDERDVQSGQRSLWGFGDKATSTNPLIDLAGRLVLDPINATVIAGPAGLATAATRIPGIAGATRGADSLLRLAEARAIVKGIPALQRSALSTTEGVAVLRGAVPVSVQRALGITDYATAGSMFRAAALEGVTHRSLGVFLMGMGRGGTALLNGYRKAAIGTTIAQIGVNAVDDVLADKSGVPGPINDLFVLGRAIAEDKPLSEGMLFNLWSIMHFPVRDMVGSVRDAAKGKVRYWWKTGADIEAKMTQLLEEKRGGSYAEQRARMIERMGGAEGLLDYLAMVSIKSRAGGIAAAFRERPVVRSMVEAQEHGRLMNEMAWDEIRLDPVSGREVVDATVDWATSARRVKDFEGGLRNTFSPERFYEEWTAWRAVAQQTSKIGQGAAVPKLNQVLIRENIDVARARFHRVAKDGMVSPDDAIRIINDNPALMVHEKTGGMWARLIVRDHEPVDVKWIDQRLDDVYEDAISMRSALAPAEQWENRAAREAAHRAGFVRSDGTLDFDRLPTDGNVEVLVPTANDLGRRNAGFPARTLDDVAAMRSDPVIADLASPETIRIVDESGYALEMVKQGVVGEQGALSPALLMTFDPKTNPQAAAEVVSTYLRESKTSGHGRVLVRGDAVDVHGKTPNAMEFTWKVGPHDPSLRRSATDALNRLFDESIIDDTAGVYRIVIPEERLGRLLPRITEANRALGEMFPGKAVGGVFEGSNQRVWTETIRNTAKENPTRGRTARSATERSIAAVERDAELSTNWHALQQGFRERDPGVGVRVAPQPGPDAGPVRQAPPEGELGVGAGDPGRGIETTAQVAERLRAEQTGWPIPEGEFQVQTRAPHGWVSRGTFATREEANAFIASGSTGSKTTGQRIVGRDGFVGERPPIPAPEPLPPPPGVPADGVRWLQGDLDYLTSGDPGRGVADFSSTNPEGITLYHGTSSTLPDNLDVLPPARPDAGPLMFGDGFYTTPDINVAREYTRHYASPDNPGSQAIYATRWTGDQPPRVIRGNTRDQALFDEVLEGAQRNTEYDLASVVEAIGDDVGYEPTMDFLFTALRRSDDQAAIAGAQRVLSEKADILVMRDVTAVGGDRATRMMPLPTEHESWIFLDPRKVETMAIEGTPLPPPPGVPAEGVRWLQDRDAEVTQFVPNYDASLTDRFTADELVPFARLQEDLTRYDPTYTLSRTPKGGTPYEPGQGRAYQDIAAVRQLAGDTWTYRVGSKAANLWHGMFGKVYTKKLQDDMKQELMSDLVMADAKPREVNHFLRALAREADAPTHFPNNVRLYQRLDMLPPDTIDQIAHGIRKIEGFEGFPPEVLAKLGRHGASQAIRRSSSRFYRKLEQNHRLGSGNGSLGKLLDYTYGPATAAMNGPVGKGTGMIRAWYPIFRFVSDLRWHAMNKAEAGLIGAIRFGVGDVGESGLTSRSLRAMDRTPTNPLDVRVVGSTLDDAMASGWLDHRKLEGIIGPAYDAERIATTRKALLSLAEDDPIMVTMRRRYGEDATPGQLVDDLDRMMYDFDVQGVSKTVTEEARSILDDADYAAMRPFIQQLTRQHERNFRDVIHSFRGNTNRSNMERMANSYFLYWPISYQLKVGKVLFDTLTYRSFGRQTDLLGAWTIDRLMKEHTKRLVDDPSYREMFEENPELWRAAGMFLPITPMDIGVSMSRFTRYVGSALGAQLNLWPMDPSYPDITTTEGVLEFSSRIMQMGPLYTADLLARAARELRE